MFWCRYARIDCEDEDKIELDSTDIERVLSMTIQSEVALENGLISTLQQMSYEYVQITEEANLMSNFKKQLEIHNKRSWQTWGVQSLVMPNLRRYRFILRVAHVLKRRRNCETCFRLTLTMGSVSGLNF